MVEPSLRISIDCTSLGLAPVLCSAVEDDAPWAIVGYTEPARQPRIGYATDSPYVPGSTATSATWQQSILPFDLRPRRATSELEVRVLYAGLLAALSQFTYTTTVESTGFADIWRCDPGTIAATDRDYVSLKHFVPVYGVSIPVQPIPTLTGG